MNKEWQEKKRGSWYVRRLEERPEGGWESGWGKMEGGRMENKQKGGGCCFKISPDECVSPLWGRGSIGSLSVTPLVYASLRGRSKVRWVACVHVLGVEVKTRTIGKRTVKLFLSLNESPFLSLGCFSFSQPCFVLQSLLPRSDRTVMAALFAHLVALYPLKTYSLVLLVGDGVWDVVDWDWGAWEINNLLMMSASHGTEGGLIKEVRKSSFVNDQVKISCIYTFIYSSFTLFCFVTIKDASNSLWKVAERKKNVSIRQR